MSLYGATFSQKLLQRGDFDEAVGAATTHVKQDPENPEPYLDRARALAALHRYEEAVADFASAIDLDQREQMIPEGDLDDGLFSTVIAWAQEAPEAQRLPVLARYLEILPAGGHKAEAEEWSLRFRGLLKSTWVKPRD